MEYLAWTMFGLCSLVAFWWLAVIARIGRMHATGLSLRRGLDLEVDTTQQVTIVVPAHNEERVLAKCIDGVLAQTWPALNVVVALDRCTDASESIVRSRAEQDDRLSIVRLESCPPDWAGKCNALRHGAEQADGEWLLFLDADTSAHPDLVRALVATGEDRDVALLSLLPDLDCSSWFERVSQPVAGMALMQMYPLDRVNRDHRNRPFANGQCMLFRREWYRKVGGHVAVHDALLEDLAFGRVIDAAGGRVRTLKAQGLLTVSMYGDWQAFRRGWTRIFLEGAQRRVRKLGQYAVRQEVLGAGPPVAMAGAIWSGLALAMPAVWVAGVVALVLQLVALACVYHISRQPLWCTVLFPFGCFEVGRAMRRARRLLLTGAPVKWGGREYVLEPR